jgi:uncharacterized protein YdaU (DUF1376 family)
MATDLPWFPMYPNDFLTSTMSMSNEVLGAYIRLLCYAWVNDGIPDDRNMIDRISGGLTDEGWNEIRERLVLNGDRSGDRDGDRRARWVHPRMERERAKTADVRSARQKAAEQTNNRRLAARNNGQRSGDRDGDRIGERPYSQSQSQSQSQKQPTPCSPPRGTVGGVVDIKDSELKRLVMREPAWRTRIERAEAGDWLDEDKQPIDPSAILATAMNTVRERTINERDTIIERVTAKGLSDGEAAQLWRAWFVEHMNGGPAPGTAMRNDLNDKSIRNHASVWRARLGGKYTPDHGEVTQGSGAAGGDG